MGGRRGSHGGCGEGDKKNSLNDSCEYTNGHYTDTNFRWSFMFRHRSIGAAD